MLRSRVMKRLLIAAGALASCRRGVDRAWRAGRPTGGRGQGGRGGGRGAAPRTRKAVLAWADTRNGIAQHDSVSHALAVIERLGYESGLYDTYIRTDSNIISKQPLMTDGKPASGGPSLANVDAIFFLGHREVPLDAQQKADLLSFVKDDGKGFVAAHTAPTAFLVAGVRRAARRALRRTSVEHGVRHGHQRGSGVPGDETFAAGVRLHRRVLSGEGVLARQDSRAAAARRVEDAAEPGGPSHGRRLPAGVGEDVRQGARVLLVARPRGQRRGTTRTSTRCTSKR